MLPTEIPLFPLPNVVLFPTALLPLHIFEPRYRAMVTDALENERMIGMVMLQPGWEADYEGTPKVYRVGCAGFITHAEPLPGGRYNIMLRGLEKFRILDERFARDGAERYRLARVESIGEAPRTNGPAADHARRRLESVIAKRLHRNAENFIAKDISDEELINAIAQHLEPLEKQALLECNGTLDRCQTLVELLEMKTLTSAAGKTKLH